MPLCISHKSVQQSPMALHGHSVTPSVTFSRFSQWAVYNCLLALTHTKRQKKVYLPHKAGFMHVICHLSSQPVSISLWDDFPSSCIARNYYICPIFNWTPQSGSLFYIWVMPIKLTCFFKWQLPDTHQQPWSLHRLIVIPCKMYLIWSNLQELSS